MAEEIPQPRAPGSAIVPRNTGGAASGVPSRLLAASDFTVGAAARASRVALRLGEMGWDASVAARRLVSALPGADGVGRHLSTVARPLVDDGHRVRARAGPAARARTQLLLEALVPRILDAVDLDVLVQRIDVDAVVGRIDVDRLVRRIEIDALVQRIDIDRLVRRIEIDALVRRIDIDQLVRRIEIDALVRRIDMDALVQRIDVGEIAARIDVNEVVQRVDVDAIVEETELGTIVARSTGGFASQALDSARNQTAGVDTRVSRAVNRVLRRKEGELPAGPPLLTGETDTTSSPPASGVEHASPDAPGTEPE